MISLNKIEDCCGKIGAQLINIEAKKEFNLSDSLILQLPCGTPRSTKVRDLLDEASVVVQSKIHTCTSLENLNLELSLDGHAWCISIKDTLGRGVYPILHCPGCGTSLTEN